MRHAILEVREKVFDARKTRDSLVIGSLPVRLEGDERRLRTTRECAFPAYVAALANTRTRSERPFAIIPLLFGIQQLSEGVIWLTLRHPSPALQQTMTYVYAGFAYVLWPIYAPLAIGIPERVPWRRRAIVAFLVAGIVVGLYLLKGIVTGPVSPAIVGKHIVYTTPQFYLPPVPILYLAATCVSCFFSSHGFVRLFGVLALLSALAAYVVHVTALVSIWCFFAAILSLLIYIHLRFRTMGGFPADGAHDRDWKNSVSARVA
ncbi:MAG: DUF6629 family protein [bacterium]